MAIPGYGLQSISQSDIYGRRPVLPTSSTLGNNVLSILNNAIPGFSNLTNTGSSIIGSALSGEVPSDVRNIINNSAAARAVAGGMPGTSNIPGTVFGNKSLYDLGITSLQQQQTGLSDLIKLLQGFSGTAAPTVEQVQSQENAREKYSSAPEPSAAAAKEEELFNKYSNPAAGTVGSMGPTTSSPWSPSGQPPISFYSSRLGRVATPAEIYGTGFGF